MQSRSISFQPQMNFFKRELCVVGMVYPALSGVFLSFLNSRHRYYFTKCCLLTAINQDNQLSICVKIYLHQLAMTLGWLDVLIIEF